MKFQHRPPDLPIITILSALKAALQERRSVVLQAAPGAGKSTVVPLELLDEPWLKGLRIIVLEPRRLAARAVAARMAGTLGEPIGRTVGYRMRLDTRVSSATRIEVVTEGVLASLLHEDPALEDVGCVIFDEFHERSLQADLGLALCLDVQANLHPGLRLLVMSATLAVEPVARLLGDAVVVSAAGRSFPVDIRYAAGAAPARGSRPGGGGESQEIVRQVAAVVRKALSEEQGDLLVFLPGAPEIRRVQSLLDQSDLGSQVALAPLFGDLPQQEQDRALQPGSVGCRKVVLATNIAETSLTIEGVRVVVDSGFARRARFDPVSGMSRLETLRISRASAEQRCGRAGRVSPGVCYRLWSEGAQQSLEAHTPAEILEADLAPLALELAGWNVSDPRQLRWLDSPPAAAYTQARDLLRELGALDEQGRMTVHGRQMLALRIHPRLAHMLLKARELGMLDVACDLAALLGERDILRTRPGERDADVRTRLELLSDKGAGLHDVDRGALERVRRTAGQYRRSVGQSSSQARVLELSPVDVPGALLALAYPDRIARARDGGAGRYLLSNGRGAFFAEPQNLARSEFLAIAELDAGEREARIFLAAPLSSSALEEVFADRIETVERIAWDSQQKVVVAQRERRLGALVVEQTALDKSADSEAMVAAMLEGIREMGLQALPWDDETRSWRARVMFVRGLEERGRGEDKEWPDVSDEGLAQTMEDWLAPWLEGKTRRDHLARLDLGKTLEAMLDWQQRQRLDELAPTHVAVPSGSRIRIDYLDGETPSLAVRLQEIFGMTESPRIGAGQVSLLVKLLSPAHRPVQVTRDLASFWRTGYAEVRKELKGRYPRHYWPEDPHEAQAIRGSRRRT